MTSHRAVLRVLASCAPLLVLAGCGSQEPRPAVLSPRLRKAADDLARFVRDGWHLPFRVRLFPAGAVEGRAKEPSAAEEALALAQLDEVREAYARTAFDFFGADVTVSSSAREPRVSVLPDPPRVAIELGAPEDGAPPRPATADAIVDALGQAFAWDKGGRWYEGEPIDEVVRALERDLAKLDRLEDELALDCRRLELVAAAAAVRSTASGREILLTPSETQFARAAQLRSTFALHRVLNTLARWKAASEDEGCPVRREALLVLERARLVHEAYLGWFLEVVVGERTPLKLWTKEFWQRNPLYLVLDARETLGKVELELGKAGEIPAGSVRALLAIRCDAGLSSAYASIDVRAAALDPKALREGRLGAATEEAARRAAATRAVLEKHATPYFSAWKELWDARLKGTFSFPFYNMVSGISRFIGHTRVSARPPAVSKEQLARLAVALRPGDVVLVRQEGFLSNVFLPGFWTHAMLWLGSPEAWGTLELEPGRRLAEDPIGRAAARECARPREDGPVRVIEAVGDGVRLSSLEHAVRKDDVVVLRPEVDEGARARAIRAALACLGRPYDFDFDFATDDRLVCTELVYRAYDPVLNFRVQVDLPQGAPAPPVPVPGLLPVLGRLTMPANELARYALFMQERPAADPKIRYPGRRLSIVRLLLEPPGSGKALELEGAEALAAFRESVAR